MIIIGIDPGLTLTGAAAYDATKGTFLDVYTAKGLSGTSLEARMQCITEHVIAYMDQYVHNSTVFAIENNHVTAGRSAQTALKQRELIGVMAARAHGLGMEVVRIAPATGKKALTGAGNSSKEEMVRHAVTYVNIDDLNQDAKKAVADAMGVCLAAAGRLEDG